MDDKIRKIALGFAVENCSDAVYPAHLFKAVLHKDAGLVPFIESTLDKDYYYLPKEDIAIHKSVASFVDKEYREKAKASNCYNRKEGEFLPQYEEIMHPEFRKEYKDKVRYFELTTDFISSDIMLRRYISHIFKLCQGFSK